MTSNEQDLESMKSNQEGDNGAMCHPGYLATFPGVLRILNIILGGTLFGLWLPGYEHDYRTQKEIVNFRDISKNYGAGYKSETLNQFVFACIILSLLASVVLLVALIAIPHSHVDWNRMNKLAHAALAIFHGSGAICASVGSWYFEENCCRVDLEWNGIGFRYKPAILEFGYPKNNFRCNCWLTKRTTSLSDMDSDSHHTTELWEPEHYPDKYPDESMFVSFAAHHIHIHVAASALMMLNTAIYVLASCFTKPHATIKK